MGFMSKRFEVPNIDPDPSIEYSVGGFYRMDMHYFHQNLPQLLRLPDVLVDTGDILLQPGGSCLSIAFVPKDYFPEHLLKAAQRPELRALIKDETVDEYTAMYIRYLLEARLFSIKSKLAQSCLEHEALKRSRGYLTYPVSIQDEGFYFPLEIRNLNPQLTYRMPNEPFRAFRFYIPGRTLTGQDLLMQAKAMQLHGLELADPDKNYYTPQTFDQLPPTDRLLWAGSQDQITSIVMPIEREAFFAQKKVVNIQDLLDCSSKDRGALDKIWGIQWREKGASVAPMDGEEVIISESGPLIMPSDTAGVIDHRYNWQNNFESNEHGFWRHIASPLIDPGFGAPDGQPIRFEYQQKGVFRGPQLVRMFLHQSN